MIIQDKDPIGQAVADYWAKADTPDISVTSPDVEDDVIPVDYFFRSYNEMPPLEKEALSRSKGKILDVGAGAGTHALYLQEQGLDVTALEYSGLACKTMSKRGVKQIECCDIFNYRSNEKFDTILLLMNGIGLAGTLKNAPALLSKLTALLSPDGQILFDSSDLCFLFQEDIERMMEEKYYGEINFTMKYKNITGNSFDWLYVDFEIMQQLCAKHAYNLELLAEGEHFDYLAAISLP